MVVFIHSRLSVLCLVLCVDGALLCSLPRVLVNYHKDSVNLLMELDPCFSKTK
jgi:hypothetical protein